MPNMLFYVSLLVVAVAAEEYWSYGYPPMQDPDLFEGDIIGIDPHDRNAIKYDYLKWTDNTIPYVIDPSLADVTDDILEGMEQYHDNTCIRFTERTNEDDYIRIYSGIGCSSNIGMIGGEQTVSLNRRGCIYTGTIVHELMHAVGFWHEQSRVDRDDYLDIFWENISPGKERNFDKRTEGNSRTFGSYDYDSIMHYGEYAFAKDRSSKTMVAKKKGVVVKEPYQKPGFTTHDIEKIKQLYC